MGFDFVCVEARFYEIRSHIVLCNPSLQRNKKIQVKITGDGTYVSRSMHILVIAFTIVDVMGEKFSQTKSCFTESIKVGQQKKC